MTTTEKRTALKAFIEHNEKINALLKRISAHTEDHLGVSPDEVNWGHVGTMAHMGEELQDIADRLFGEGEYA